MKKRFAAIRAERFLKGLDAEPFATRAAEHISEINAIHPFLDGNGRAQRALLESLADKAGHPIDMARLDPNAWNDASIKSFHGQDYGPMRDVIIGMLVVSPD